ncbi:Primosomal replication protein N'' [Rosenbergiella nectarea]|uniref:Primosomal replication protein N n=1 Tax=Rosenbergiella nectarea TaxID=988801 RepID=A0A1H9IH08_9GAMM|nr:primosomal replication protein PriC [Rosenbergiella nectarea]SEQ73675.1 Primosomal replication protein N'' [Rosenbergiella nectarea]
MNQKVVVSQLRKLLEHLTYQVKGLSNSHLKTLGFERQLFKNHYSTLNGYLEECVQTLNRIEHNTLHLSSTQWQLEHLVEQCQAIQKVIYTLPAGKRQVLTPQEELAGYERRLLKMVADLEHQVATATGFQEQQQLLSTLEMTQQRLNRCQTAQKDYSWKKSVT